MFSRSRKHIYFKFGRCEKLEDRNMLVAHMFAAFPIAGHFIPLPVAAIHGGHQAGGCQPDILIMAAAITHVVAADHIHRALTDPNSTAATGAATDTTSTMCGTTTSSLSVSVTGVAAGASR